MNQEELHNAIFELLNKLNKKYVPNNGILLSFREDGSVYVQTIQPKWPHRLVYSADTLSEFISEMQETRP